jgi:hypothetical protein
MLVQSTLSAPTREKMDIELPFLVDHRRASLFDIPRFTIPVGSFISIM